MNSYERVMMAFNHKEADRVPLSEQGVSEQVLQDWGCKDNYEFQQKMGYDMLMVRIRYRKSNETDDKYTDEWGVGYRRLIGEPTDHSIYHPIVEPEDIDKLILPDPDDPYHFNFLEQALKDYKGEKAICFSSRAFFLWAVELCGMDNILMLMALEPEFCKELFDKILENQIAVYKNAVRMGADICMETDDYAYDKGPLMSPAMFAEFCEPRIKRWSDALQAMGAKTVKHTDGNIMSILDSIQNAGVDGIQSIDPSAGMKIKEVKEKYGDRLCLIGNIDCASLLSYAQPQEVYDAVKQTIRDAAPGGGFILTSSNTLTTTTRKENYQAMLDALKDWGNYPLKF